MLKYIFKSLKTLIITFSPEISSFKVKLKLDTNKINVMKNLINIVISYA